MDILKPKKVVTSISNIDLDSYWLTGKRGIIIDLDNTIIPWDNSIVNEDAHNLLIKALTCHYKIFILTNAGEIRTQDIANQYGIPYIAHAIKPRKSVYLKALDLMELKPHQVIVIGDQIFTDILGGNIAGCYTILVPAISKREFIGTKILRLFEKIINNNTVNKV
ncbi:MAG: YqeG family HAD IIIA-type phosphatase [Clostridia bacterium]|nr:YqeG family HAD IIIA-type phosphatase [Clostridia bacterium]MDD4047763.1 YqeG family HAD IIIA-type phosphatase [Clostridia bacterium]